MTDKEPSMSEWISTLPPELQPQMRRWIGEAEYISKQIQCANVASAPTEEALKEQGRAFKATLEPPTSDRRAYELQQEILKVQRALCHDFNFKDNDELRFLRNYVRFLQADRWNDAQRTKFINELIEWAYDDEYDTSAESGVIQNKLAEKICKKKAELEELECELRGLEGK